MSSRLLAVLSLVSWGIAWLVTGAVPIPALPASHNSDVDAVFQIHSDCTAGSTSIPGRLVSIGGMEVPDISVTIVGADCTTPVAAWSVIHAQSSVVAEDGSGRSRYVIFPHSVPSVVSESHGLVGWAATVREGLREIAAQLPGPGGQLLPGLAVGDTSLVTDDLADSMRATSLTHLMAVSGANCAIVVGLVFGISALAGAPRFLRVILSVIALGLFVLIVTPEPSVVRASIMALIGLGAVWLGRHSFGVSALSLAVIVSLIADPWLAREYGFVLSVVATASLIVISPMLVSRLRRRMPHWAAIVFSVPIAATLGCQPIIMLLTPSLPLFGVLANVLAAPFAPVATVVGMIAALTAPIPLLGLLFTGMAWLPASVIAYLAKALSMLPFAEIHWPSGWVGVVCAATMSLGVVVMLRHFRGGLLTWSLGLVVGLSLASGSTVVSYLSVPNNWTIAQCDVGQGDAMLYSVDGQVLLIDTGLEVEPIVRCLDMLKVSRIDVLLLTHFDADHCGAAASLGRPIGRVLHGPTPDNSDLNVIAQLTRQGTRATQVWAGDSFTLGSQSVSIVWPFKDIPTEPSNPASVVSVLRPRNCDTCVSFLNLGDLPAAEQRRMASRQQIPQVDVVKVSHHGSRDNDARTYASARAALAFIGVGEDNTYGHPTDDALAMVASAGSRIVRSDERGTVVVSIVDGSVRLWSERRPG